MPRRPQAATPALPVPVADDDDEQRLRSLPREMGALLLIVGFGGLLLPGPFGTPFLLMGGVVLWPAAFERLERSFRRRFPGTHRQGMKQLMRFVDDLERRYPSPS